MPDFNTGITLKSLKLSGIIPVEILRLTICFRVGIKSITLFFRIWSGMHLNPGAEPRAGLLNQIRPVGDRLQMEIMHN